MSVWLTQHRTAVGSAFSRLLATPLNTLLSLLVISIALLLPAAGYVALGNLAALGRNATNVQEISIFMAVEASRADADAVAEQLKTNKVGPFRFVAREDALTRLKTRADLAEILDSLSDNPLPDAFIVTPGDTSPASLDHWAKTFESWPKVANVQLDSAWIKRFDAFVQLGKICVSLLAGLFAAALIAVTFNTIRLQILAQAQEIEVAKLIGATNGFIRRPYYYFGVIQGMLGGALAAGLLFIGLYLIGEPIARLSLLYGSHFTLLPPNGVEIGALILFGGLLGWLGAQFSVSLYLRSIDAA